MIDMNTVKIIRIRGLSSVSPTFRLLDMNRPLSPQPQSIHYAPTFFLIDDEILVEYERVNAHSPLSTRLEKLLQEKHSWQIKHTFSTKNTADSMDIPSGLQSLPQGSIKDQCYSLTIQGNSILLLAFTDAGLFYGIGALSQLIHHNQGKWVVQQVEIQDYPTIPDRGFCISLDNLNQIPIEEIIDLLSGLLLVRMNTFEIITVGEPQNIDVAKVRIVQEFAEQNFIKYTASPSLEESVITFPSLSNPSQFLDLQQITKSLAILSKNSIETQKTKLLLNVSSSTKILPDWRNLIHGIGVGLDWAWNPIDRPKDHYYRAFYAELFGMHNPHLFADMIEKVSELSTLLSPEADSTYSKRKWQKWSRNLSIAREMATITNRTILRHQEFMKAIEVLLDQLEQNLKRC
ncbi:MAG: glycoside hydrolase family 20 zincin-like fold domain-containing protein [Promethearchaeota archaeon]